MYFVYYDTFAKMEMKKNKIKINKIETLFSFWTPADHFDMLGARVCHVRDH